MGANVFMEFEKNNFNWGHFFLLGAFFSWVQWGANVLVEFKMFFNCGGGHFFGGQKIILGSRKSVFFGNYLDP